MLEANKFRLFESVFSIYNSNLIKRRFNSFRINGLEYLLNKPVNIPHIIYCNHSSWWDGLAAFQISRKANLDSYFMMEEKQLKDLPLFRNLGAYSIVREKPKEAIKSVNYSVQMLKKNFNTTVWIFPQGMIMPNDFRPLKFYNGISAMIQKLNICLVTSLAIRFEFLGDFKPDIFVKIEEPVLISVEKDFSKNQMTKNLADRLTLCLDELKNDIVYQNLSDYLYI